MKIIETTLPGVLIIEPSVFEDPRGFFFETYHQSKFNALGIDCSFVQDNHSRSGKETLRGLHYQLQFPQAKLCRVIEGMVLDVAVDIRMGSPFFGKWVGVLLSVENKRQIFVPRGFAHGYLVLSDTAEFLYKCDAFYHPEDEGGVLWNDPEIGIAWNCTHPILSNKDQCYLTLSQIPAKRLPKYS
ncbi:MAG: dTDP-4-dehydrorhamnose 3,5-epimerase [Nitrospirota bacterium]